MQTDFLNLKPARPRGLWRDVPPAIFPPMLGLLGLGLGWRRGASSFGLDIGVSDLVLGAVILLFAFGVLAYGVKLARRPGVVLDDLHVLPGRAGLAALTDSVMLSAAVLLAYAPGLGEWVLWIGLALHATLALLLTWVMARGPAERRRVTPIWHLSYVGFILAPLAAVPLGYVALSGLILQATMAAAVLIRGVSAVQFARASVPAPLRPLLAVHLAPACLFAIVAASIGLNGLALGFGVLALAMFFALLSAGRWIAAAGFSPFWGAFTFPIAAFANMGFALDAAGFGAGWRFIGMLALVAATVAVPVIAVKVLKLWAKGQLAGRTNAAVA